MSASSNAALIPLFLSSPLAKSLHCAGNQAEDGSIRLRCLFQLWRIFRLRRPLLRRRGRCCFCSRAGGGAAGRLFRVPCLLAQDLPHNGFNGGPVYGRSCRPYRLGIICKVSIVENDCIGRKRLHWRYTVLSRGQAAFPAVRQLPDGSGH